MRFIDFNRLVVYSVLKKFIITFSILFCTNLVFADNVQIAYSITNEGNIRVFSEHRHTNQTVAQNATAQFNMIIFYPSTWSNFSSLHLSFVWGRFLDDPIDYKTTRVVEEICDRANTELFFQVINEVSTC